MRRWLGRSIYSARNDVCQDNRSSARSANASNLDGAVVGGLSSSGSSDASWWRVHVGLNDFDTALASASQFGGAAAAEVPPVANLARRAIVADPNGIRMMLIDSTT